MKKKVLIIFKYPHPHWNIPVINRFSNYYEIESLYINDIKDKNFTETIEEINNQIKLKNIEVTVFDVDYFKFINFFFIEKINCKKKILISGDDFELHEINSITASACDLVLTTCPLSVLKYKEKGYKSYFMVYENYKANKITSEKKEIDVLFFGELTPDRKDYLAYIEKQGISLKNVGFNLGDTKLSDEELLQFIRKSKIILNLSKSRTISSVNNYALGNIFKFQYQFKGRIWDAGLNGVTCVSEYAPALEIFFKDDEIPTFASKEECANTLKKLLNNDDLLDIYRNKFTSKVHELIDDKKHFKPIYNEIEKLDRNKRVKLNKFPYWYLRIAAKQVILRNIKLTNLIKSVFQFNVVFEVVKSSNFSIKLLIILESILNVLWYSFTFSFKSKK